MASGPASDSRRRPLRPPRRRLLRLRRLLLLRSLLHRLLRLPRRISSPRRPLAVLVLLLLPEPSLPHEPMPLPPRSLSRLLLLLLLRLHRKFLPPRWLLRPHRLLQRRRLSAITRQRTMVMTGAAQPSARVLAPLRPLLRAARLRSRHRRSNQPAPLVRLEVPVSRSQLLLRLLLLLLQLLLLPLLLPLLLAATTAQTKMTGAMPPSAVLRPQALRPLQLLRPRPQPQPLRPRLQLLAARKPAAVAAATDSMTKTMASAPSPHRAPRWRRPLSSPSHNRQRLRSLPFRPLKLTPGTPSRCGSLSFALLSASCVATG